MATRSATRRGLPSTAGVPAAADRRFRRADVRGAGRRGWRSGLGRLALAGGAGLTVVWLTAWAAHAFTQASVFSVDHVSVHGNAQLTADDVRALVDGVQGQSIFHVDLEAYRLQVIDSPWVADATLSRVFPSTVEIRITERAPLAIARLNRQLFLVDHLGIIDGVGPQYREFDLPIVDGLLSTRDTGTVPHPDGIRLVERLLAELSAQSDLLRRVSQVDVSNPRNAVVLLDNEPARLYLGDGEFLARLRRYEEAAPAVRERVADIDYYDLRFEQPVVGTAATAPDRAVRASRK